MSSDDDSARQAALDYHRLPRPGKLEIRATKPLENGLFSTPVSVAPGLSQLEPPSGHLRSLTSTFGASTKTE